MFLPLKCFPWPPSHLPEKGDYLLFCCGPVFILVSLCLFCCVMALLCHPPTRPWFPLSFFIYLLIGGKLLYIVVLVSLSSLPWHARGGLKVVVTGRFSTCCVYTILHRAGAVLRASHLLLRAHLILTVILLRSDPFCRANKQ